MTFGSYCPTFLNKGKNAPKDQEGVKMLEKEIAPYGLRLVREGIQVGEIPYDSEVEVIEAYFYINGDAFYQDLKVVASVIYNTPAKPNQIRVGEHLPRIVLGVK